MRYTETNPRLPIHFEDDHLLLINKPAGVLSQGDRTGDPDVVSLCKKYLSQPGTSAHPPFVGPVHRLDRPVSGLMLVAKTSNAASQLSKQVQNRTIQKTYRAVVQGEAPANGMLVHHLKKDRTRNIVQAVKPGISKAKRAELSFVCLSAKEKLTLLSVHLQTGRSHQIRVQLAEENYPVWGDYKYGAAQPDGREIALQAAELVFEHPFSEKRLKYELDLPEWEPWNQF